MEAEQGPARDDVHRDSGQEENVYECLGMFGNVWKCLGVFRNVWDSGKEEKDAGIYTKGDKLCFSKDTAYHNIFVSP